jgi:opacity protein-like surface antigen
MRMFVLIFAALLLLAAPAAAGPVAGIEAMTSTIFQEHQSSFSGLGVRLRLAPERLIKGVEILPTLEYWRNSSSIGAFGIEATRKDATIGVDGRYRFHVGNFEPYAGLGIGVHFLSARVNAPQFGLTDANDSLVKGGLTILGGLNFELTERVGNFIELKYHDVSDYRQLKFNWGLGYNF